MGVFVWSQVKSNKLALLWVIMRSGSPRNFGRTGHHNGLLIQFSLRQAAQALIEPAEHIGIFLREVGCFPYPRDKVNTPLE
jgi:hypothetical protein